MVRPAATHTADLWDMLVAGLATLESAIGEEATRELLRGSLLGNGSSASWT